jgi:transcriptional regulator with XRE-family HTH domain
MAPRIPKKPELLAEIIRQRFTIEAFARLVGVTRDSMGRIIYGHHEPLTRHVNKMCEVLGKSEAELGLKKFKRGPRKRKEGQTGGNP